MAAAEEGVTEGHPLWFVPVLHPAYIIRGQHAQVPLQIQWLQRATKLLSGWEPPDLEQPPGTGLSNPTLVGLLKWENELRDNEDWTVAIDIECAGRHLLDVGLMAVQTMSYLRVPFRGDGGERYWSDDQLPEVIAWLDVLLGDPEVPKVFHNGQAFDVPYLRNLGFRVAGYAFDTLIAQRYLYPEHPADLAFVASFYCDLPGWKHLSNLEEEGEGK